MGLFRKKTPEQLAEIKAKRNAKIAEAESEKKAKIKANEYRIRKLNIDGENPDVDYHEISLSLNELNRIFQDLQKVGRYSGIHGESPEEQRNPARYSLGPVQRLLDYAKGCRFAMDWMMKESIKSGVAHYDDTGTFKFKHEEKEEDESTVG